MRRSEPCPCITVRLRARRAVWPRQTHWRRSSDWALVLVSSTIASASRAGWPISGARRARHSYETERQRDRETERQRDREKHTHLSTSRSHPYIRWFHSSSASPREPHASSLGRRIPRRRKRGHQRAPVSCALSSQDADEKNSPRTARPPQATGASTHEEWSWGGFEWAHSGRIVGGW